MRVFILSISMLLLSVSSWSQKYNWFKTFGGSGDDRISYMLMDSNGDLLITGTFQNTVDFDPSSNLEEHTSNGWNDVFVAKYDTTGALIWVKTFGGSEWDYSTAFFVDASDNIYVGGNYGSTMDINPGIGVTTLVPSGGLSAYLVKLNGNGEYEWSRNLTGGTDLRINSIKEGPQGIVCSGSFWGTSQFNNEGTSVTMTSDNSQDVYVLTVDVSGNFVQVNQIGNGGQNLPRGFDVDETGNIYITYEFEGSIDVDPGPGTTTIVATNSTSYGQILAKYNSAMELIWVKAPAFPTYSQFRQLEVNSADEIVFIGYFKDSIQFNLYGDPTWYISNGDDDLFIGKINAIGEMQWLRTFGNDSEDDTGKLHIDEIGNIYLFDSFQGTIDTDLGASINMATSVGSFETYILKLDSSGNTQWFLQDSTDFPFAVSIGALCSGTQNDVYVLYNFFQEMGLFQNGTLESFTSEGDYDLLMVQLKADNYLSLEETNFNNYLVYPNPVNQTLYLSGLKEGQSKDYILLNMEGRQILQGETNGVIDISKLTSGIYLLKIQGVTYRIVVE